MPDYLFLILIPVFLIMGYFALKGLHQKGWSALQKRFHFDYDYFNGEKLRIRQMSISGVNHQNTLEIKASGQGLYLKLIFPFNAFSKPLLIPWDEIVDIQDSKVLLMKFKRLIIGKPFISTIEMSEKDFKKVQKYIMNK